jgi:hypothetical protein
LLWLRLVVAFAYTALTPAAPHKASANAVPTAAPQPNTATAAAAEPFPEIREAMGAAHDFGGHRVEAIRATDVAIHQLEDRLKSDKD